MFLRNTATIVFISCHLAQIAFTDPTEVEDPLVQLFNFYDENHDGAIVAAEIMKAFKWMKIVDFTAEEVEARAKEYSPNGDGVLSMADFRNMMGQPVDDRQKKEAFQSMSGGQNYISAETLRTILGTIDLKFTDADLHEIDTNGDSQITFEELNQSKVIDIPVVVE